jgi:hypothetical protein
MWSPSASLRRPAQLRSGTGSAMASARSRCQLAQCWLPGHPLWSPDALAARGRYCGSGRSVGCDRRGRNPETSVLALRDIARRVRLVRSARITQGGPHLILLLHREI